LQLCAKNINTRFCYVDVPGIGFLVVGNSASAGPVKEIVGWEEKIKLLSNLRVNFNGAKPDSVSALNFTY
jgi:hypothetical protein